ncbi:MAG: class I SAM-dependent methyltransferase [Acidobacteria bacterium]|jgi:ubiquinone/menaquinone biosynthesis C-methylase UbiE|nr:class I SAM-dependent methyltransferase [Acidobacteriota bacterium]
MRKYPDSCQALEGRFALSGATVIDVGCGNGDTVRWLAARGARAIGLDGRDMLARAMAHPAMGTETYVEGGAQWLPFADAGADLILFLASLHHVPVDLMPAAASECRRVLKTGGRVVFVEPVYRAGAYSDLTRLVEDESGMLERAQAEIAALAGRQMEKEHEETFYLERSFADYEQLVDFFVAEAERRAPILAAARRITERFSAVAGLDAADFRYRSICRLNILRKVAS